MTSCPGNSAKRVFALDVPGIHVLLAAKTWVAGTSPAMTNSLETKAIFPIYDFNRAIATPSRAN